MAAPLVPFEFDPPSRCYEEAHLVYTSADGGQNVSWPLVGANLFLPEAQFHPEIKEIEAQNEGSFKAHGLSGYSIGTYHEFLVGIEIDKYAAFKLGGIEASFGLATPLAALVFEGHHRGKYFGEWEHILSLRVLGVDLDEVEATFINACAAFQAKFGALPTLYPLDEDLIFRFWELEEDDTNDPEVMTAPPIITNIEPLRFFYHGLAQVDAAAACIYFYRVLEYFSFFTNARQIKQLRHDATLSDAEFSKRILDLVSRDEKGPIFKLISALVDSGLLSNAVTEGLIKNPAISTLSEAVYEFRNSIVHGKFSHGYALQSGSVIGEDSLALRWRTLLQELAKRALNQYGSKKT